MGAIKFHPDGGDLIRDGNGAGIPRIRRGPVPKRGKFPAPVGDRGGDGEKSFTRSGGGGGGGGKFPAPFLIQNYKYTLYLLP